MSNFSTSKSNRSFDFITSRKNIDGVFHLKGVIVIIRCGSEFYFLDLDHYLFLFSFVSTFFLLIQVFTEIYDSADRRLRIWRNFYQIVSS